MAHHLLNACRRAGHRLLLPPLSSLPPCRRIHSSDFISSSKVPFYGADLGHGACLSSDSHIEGLTSISGLSCRERDPWFPFKFRYLSTHGISDEDKQKDGEEICAKDNGDEGEEELSAQDDGGNSGDDLELVSQNETRLPVFKDRTEEAAYIGYKVVGLIKPGDFDQFKAPQAFAVVQVGSHQFKISPGDCIYTEKLKFADVNDKLSLEKVLLLGSKSQTIIGRPFVPKAYVYAAVEEQVLDAKVIVFKKKRRKNYRRTKGHRQELTRLRILEIWGLGEARSAVV